MHENLPSKQAQNLLFAEQRQPQFQLNKNNVCSFSIALLHENQWSLTPLICHDALHEWVKYKIQDVPPRAASEAIINIQTLELIEGKLPRRALNLVLDWAELHQAELIEDWNLCEAKQQPKPIAPLE
jgi:hypothetical protein